MIDRPEWREDFRRFWWGYAISSLGSSIGMGELAIVAVLVLHCDDWQVSVLAAISGLVGAAITFPLGVRLEFCRKRPAMILADVVRFLALISVPIAAWLGWLSFAQLCVAGIVQVCGAVLFNAASQSHLKALVPIDARGSANGDLAATSWTTGSIGTPIGGVLVSLFGTATMVLTDAISFLFSAAFIQSLRSKEPSPPQRAAQSQKRAEIVAGWSYIFSHRILRQLLINGLLFGSGIVWVSPLLTFFMLDNLHLAPWQYGLSLGIQGLGGLAGALWSKRLVRRRGPVDLLLMSGTLRGLALGAVVLAPVGSGGFALITASETFALFFAGIFNPVFGTYRMSVTPDDRMARVATAWSVSSRVVQPGMALVGGLVAALASIRVSIAGAAALTLVSIGFLPWSARSRGQGDAGHNAVLQRMERSPVRSSVTNSSGCSKAAK